MRITRNLSASVNRLCGSLSVTLDLLICANKEDYIDNKTYLYNREIITNCWKMSNDQISSLNKAHRKVQQNKYPLNGKE